MSFNIIIQRNNSEQKQLDKVVKNLFTISGNLRNSSSVVDPIIIIETDVNLSDANYMTINSFNRKYFITDIVSVGLNRWEIHAHVDVLASFKDEIRGSSAVLKRQQNKWNLYLDDPMYKTYQNPRILTKEFPSGFTGSDFILAVAGN